MPRRNLRRDDEGISEVIGFVLSFAISAVFLMISLNTFFVAQNNSDDVVTAAELKSIAERVSARMVEAALLGQEFENVTLNLTVSIPQSLNGHPFYIDATPSRIYANTTDLPLSAEATTFNLDVVEGFQVSGRVYSSNERLVITYSLQDGGARRDIHIREAS